MESYIVESIKNGKLYVIPYNDITLNKALSEICYDFDDKNGAVTAKDLIDIPIKNKLEFIKNYCTSIRGIYVVTRENYMNDEREYVFYRH